MQNNIQLILEGIYVCTYQEGRKAVERSPTWKLLAEVLEGYSQREGRDEQVSSLCLCVNLLIDTLFIVNRLSRE